MDKNISEEKIEIGGVEYTLFLNRTGIVNWEKMTKLNKKAQKYNEMAKKLEEEEEKEVEITEDTNPFEMYSEDEDNELDEEIKNMLEIFAKFYWVALYTHHKLSLDKARELFNVALEEHGADYLIKLANKMIENANKDIMSKERKNLKALQSTQN